MSLQPFTLFIFNIYACGFVLVGPKIIITDYYYYSDESSRSKRTCACFHMSTLPHPEMLAILDWGCSIFAPPVPGGKRHNLATVFLIKTVSCVFRLEVRSSDSSKPTYSPKKHLKPPPALLADAVAPSLKMGISERQSGS